jgi:hypothetical protein
LTLPSKITAIPKLQAEFHLVEINRNSDEKWLKLMEIGQTFGRNSDEMAN